PPGLALPWPGALGVAPHRDRKRDATRGPRAPCVATGRNARLPRRLHLPRRTVHGIHHRRSAPRARDAVPTPPAAITPPHCWWSPVTPGCRPLCRVAGGGRVSHTGRCTRTSSTAPG